MGALLYFKTRCYEAVEQRRVKRLYSNERYKKADQALLKAYRGKNPYQISKQYLIEQNAADIYTYGETPITTMAEIAEQFQITDKDRVIEMGAGRGRCAIFLSEYIGASVCAYEQIPTFTKIMNTLPSKNLKVVCRDMMRGDFSWASIIYLYGTLLIDPEIHTLIKRFPKEAKIITVSYPLNAYSEDYQVLKTLSGRFPWGKTEIYLNGRIT